MKKGLFLLILLPLFSLAQTIVVQPYLQDARLNSIWISWETDNTDESTVFWGTGPLLGDTATGGFIIPTGSNRIHEVQLTGLSPATLYYYQVKTGTALSDTFHFRTPPDPASEASFRIFAASDMQIDLGNPTIWGDVVQQGMLDYSAEKYGPDLVENIGVVLIPGDLVDNGLVFDEWKNDYFAPSHPLFSQIVHYPVLGNHEVNTDFFFDYFHLPENGTSGFFEHWYYADYSNVRIIGLNSNPPFDNVIQTAWLEDVLDLTCADPNIDFVFAELHHPHQSELWPVGESGFSGTVQGLMEDFSTSCGKPSIHFFGHTHAYSRGQSRDHNHMMVNVASGGGNLDYWGEYSQIDYDDYTISQDEYGFVVVEVEAGADPGFTLKRISRGNPTTLMDNVLRDSISVRVNNISPTKPLAVFPNGQTIGPDCITLKASPYLESEGNKHMAAHWQIATNCSGFATPLYEKLRNSENWWFNSNLQEFDDLTDELVTGLAESSNFCWRVRYRDFSLGWSEWSDPAPFTTGISVISANLLNNPGAELDTAGWIVTTGILESLTSGECAGTSPHSGTYYFGIGGLCVESAFAEAYQQVDVSTWAAQIDSGVAFAHSGAWMRDYSGNDDQPEFQVYFLDAIGTKLDSTPVYSTLNDSWTEFKDITLIPPTCRAIRFYIRGTRFSGTDNDSYCDDLSLKINPYGCDNILSGISKLATYSASRLSIRPNPFSQQTQIRVLNTGPGIWDFRLIDLQGKQIRSGQSDSVGEFLLDRANLTSGIYFIEVSRGNSVLREKIVVE